ncbi:hypothetical protein RJT34_22641 [Clitoria ternatea]|uniref:Bifunctional inhibitor/plant lipid transfer protein/seed storage helical domain-containing protein n=1 Tax=Clitoria ternatea TaxID=43366 RepID=A0AAN9FLU5_CLITE
MGQFRGFQMKVILALIITSVNLVTGQINTPCTTTMINSITQCVNFITGSTNNGATPSATCCDSLLSLVSTSVECACLVITANVPLQLPIKQALSLFLPQACNLDAMPALCKALASPLPAPGPALLGSNDQTPPPFAASPLSPQAIAVAKAPEYQIPQPASVESTPTKQKRPRNFRKLEY